MVATLSGRATFLGGSMGNCEEQFPLTDCRSTVGWQITDTLPTGHRQSTDRLPTVSQNRNFKQQNSKQ